MWTWLKGLFTGKTVEKGLELADEAFHTDQEKAGTDQKDTADARANTGPSHGTWLDVLVDGWNRLPRPAFATWAYGELVGWWNVGIEKITPEKMQLIILIITFYFGGRVILKDIPSVIKALRGK